MDEHYAPSIAEKVTDNNSVAKLQTVLFVMWSIQEKTYHMISF